MVVAETDYAVAVCAHGRDVNVGAWEALYSSSSRQQATACRGGGVVGCLARREGHHLHLGKTLGPPYFLHPAPSTWTAGKSVYWARLLGHETTHIDLSSKDPKAPPAWPCCQAQPCTR